MVHVSLLNAVIALQFLTFQALRSDAANRRRADLSDCEAQISLPSPELMIKPIIVRKYINARLFHNELSVQDCITAYK